MVKESRPEVYTLILIVFIRRLSHLVDGPASLGRVAAGGGGPAFCGGNDSETEAPMNSILVVKDFPIAPITIQTALTTND